MFRPYGEISSSSTCSASVQEPTVSFESVSRLDSTVVEVFSATSSSVSSNPSELVVSLPPTVPVSRIKSTLYVAPTVEEVTSSALVSVAHDSLEFTVSSPPPTGEESSPLFIVAVSTTAIPTGKPIVYNNRRRSKKAKTVVLSSEHQSLNLSSKQPAPDHHVVLNVTMQPRQVCSTLANSLTHFIIIVDSGASISLVIDITLLRDLLQVRQVHIS